MNILPVRCYWLQLISVFMILAFSGLGCEKDNVGSDDGGSSGGGDCAAKAHNIKPGMSAQQCIRIMGNPDARSDSGQFTLLTWICPPNSAGAELVSDQVTHVHVVEQNGQVGTTLF